MINCAIWLLLLAGGVFIMLTMIRWFEQTAEAVDLGWWNKVALLVLVPFAVWLYPARVAAGRPMPVPVHEPVRGFGLNRPAPPTGSADDTGPAAPPGTPPEFLDTPVIPPRTARQRPPVERSQIEKLRQQMREQGMLDDADQEEK
jgi:hypothetical protein